jgi:hypothetical protein
VFGWTSRWFWAVFGVGVALNGLAVFLLGGYDDATGGAVGKVALALMVVGLVGEVGVRWRRRRARTQIADPRGGDL